MEIKTFDPNQESAQLGIIRNESNDFYHAVEAISNSKLAIFRKRKYLYYKKFVAKNLPEEFKKPDYFVFGGAAHCFILEGQDAFDRQYIVEPAEAPSKPAKPRHEYVDQNKIAAATLAKLEYWEKFEIEAAGLEIISQKQFRVMQYVKWAIDRHEVATALIAEIEPELTFRVNLGWRLAQVRVDGFIESCSAELAAYLNEAYREVLCKEVMPGDSIAIDLKTCATLTKDDSGSFHKHFGELGYYIQDQFYREVVSAVMGRPLDHFIFIVAEKQEPFEAAVISTDPADLELALSELKFDLEELRKCYKDKTWFSYPQEEIIAVSIPGWHRSRAEMRLSQERSRNN